MFIKLTQSFPLIGFRLKLYDLVEFAVSCGIALRVTKDGGFSSEGEKGIDASVGHSCWWTSINIPQKRVNAKEETISKEKPCKCSFKKECSQQRP